MRPFFWSSTSLAGTAEGPVWPVMEVETLESEHFVAVTLHVRNGTPGRLVRCALALSVKLREPLGRRKVYDGCTGERRNRTKREPAESEDIESLRARRR